MSIWIRGTVLSNPYRRTAFQVARIPREVVRHRTLVQLIGQTRQLIQTNPAAHAVGGEPVRSIDVNAAEQILLDPARRVMEELLEHATEKPPIEGLRKLLREIAAGMATSEGEAAGARNWKMLDALGSLWLAEFLRSQPAPNPSFGALELNTAPPFGSDKEESV